MTTYPQEYVREEFANVGKLDPIRETHRQIGIALLVVPGIRPTQRVNSPNVRGPVTENQEWEKSGTGATAGGVGGPTGDARPPA
jgi:hypothetical protein